MHIDLTVQEKSFDIYDAIEEATPEREARYLTRLLLSWGEQMDAEQARFDAATDDWARAAHRDQLDAYKTSAAYTGIRLARLIRDNGAA